MRPVPPSRFSLFSLFSCALVKIFIDAEKKGYVLQFARLRCVVAFLRRAPDGGGFFFFFFFFFSFFENERREMSHVRLARAITQDIHTLPSFLKQKQHIFFVVLVSIQSTTLPPNPRFPFGFSLAEWRGDRSCMRLCRFGTKKYHETGDEMSRS